MKIQLLVLFFILTSSILQAQTLKGVVINDQNEPIPAASIYITETKQGIISNFDGEFSIQLNPGMYRFEVRAIGFQSYEKKIEVKDKESIELTIVLEPKNISLNEVLVTPGEDPAYQIMRKAIEKAPYYRSIVAYSRYETYGKGSGKLLNFPKLALSVADKEDKDMIDLYKGKLFVQESLIEVEHTAPDQYKQTVKAFNSSAPFLDNPEEITNASIKSLYDLEWHNAISPLNPKAFNYYNFRYEGYEEEDEQTINIIRITPKLNDPKLMSGILHIADEEWNIRYADVKVKAIGAEVHYRINYHSVIDGLYLPTNYDAHIDFNIMGFEFYLNSLFSTQYFDVRIDESLQDTSPKKSEKKKKRSLEIKYNAGIDQSVDSLALSRDSSYWEKVRTIVLNEEEFASYQYKNTLKQKQDSIINKTYNPTFSPLDLLVGGNIGSDSSFVYFRYNGILGGLLKDYNFVDGLWIGQSFELDFKKRKNCGFTINPEIYWTSARKEWVWKTDISFDYSPLRLGKVSLSGGDISKDFAGNAGMNRLINSIYSVAAGRNYAKLFREQFIKLDNHIDIANGLKLTTAIKASRNTALENHTTWNIFGIKDKYEPNIPSYPNSDTWNYKDLAQYQVQLKYTPEYFYRIYNNKKYYSHSKFPTLTASFKQGFEIDENKQLNSHRFSLFEFGINQKIPLGYFSTFNYSVSGGKFFHANKLNVSELKHFSITEKYITFKSWDNSYSLLPYYSYATNEEWFQGFINYTASYLALKRLPFFQGKMFNESLRARFLHTPNKKYYTEWGYTVDLPVGMGGFGVFVSFDSFEYNSFGIELSLPIIQ
ncbi:DUF5686 and carboxypeptidase regulatory-like domain-containing protein [Bacteroidales bacterium OttesenSCG-928-M11]|nr:DUF5686 and carboxypeptidase regulatory-like domain-containing protein [Bacteroidales bacterium OttesenSCG-928-M11]